MPTSEYLYIQNYSHKGKLGISKSVFEQIVKIAANQVAGAETLKTDNFKFYFHRPVECTIENGQVLIYLQVNIKQGQNVEKICTSIQKEIADSLSQMTEQVPFSIKIKVVKIV